MINTVDLALVQHRHYFVVQGARGLEVAAERLLDNGAAPEFVILTAKSCRTELLDNFAEKLGCGGKIEQVTSRCALLLVDGRQLVRELCVKIGIAEIARVIVDSGLEPIPQLLLN